MEKRPYPGSKFSTFIQFTAKNLAHLIWPKYNSHPWPCVTALASAFCLQNSAKGKDQSNDEELDNMMTVSTHAAPGAALADDQVVEEGFLEQVAQ